MTLRLRYAPNSRYAHLNAAAFPTRYPDRETAQAAKDRIVAACGDRGDIEIVEDED